MLVGDVLNLVAQLSIGLDSPTQDDRNIFLNYLNLAHFELFSHVGLVSPTLSLQRDQLNVTDGLVDSLTLPILGAPRSVYRIDTNRELTPSSFDQITKKDPGQILQAEPTFYYYSNNVLNVWPLWTSTVDSGGGLGVVYNTQPVPFDLNSDLLIYYPLIYHQILVHGTCYYMFQTESGFKNSDKMGLALTKWEKGKSDLYNYYLGLTGRTIYSTYSRI